MTVEIEPSHKNDTVNAHLPLLAKHELCFLPECTSGDVLVAVLLGLKKLLTFREAQASESNGNGETSSDPEHSLQ